MRRPEIVGSYVHSNNVMKFVEQGGTFRYFPAVVDDQEVWYVDAVSKSGKVYPYVNRKTRKRKIIKTANGVYKFHRDHCPAVPLVIIPSHDQVAKLDYKLAPVVKLAKQAFVMSEI